MKALHFAAMAFALLAGKHDHIAQPSECRFVGDETREADKLALSSEAESLQAKVVLLDRKLDELQSKRGWRFLKFFG